MHKIKYIYTLKVVITLAYNSDILEAITKLSVEFNNKLDNLYFELNSMKQNISILNNKITSMDDSINSTINNINEIIKNIDNLNNSDSLTSELYILSTDLKFLVHKMQETEKYLFDIKYFNDHCKKKID